MTARPAIGADYSTKAVHLALVGPQKVIALEIVGLHEPLRSSLQDLRNCLIELWKPHALKQGWGTVYLEEPWMRPEKGVRTAISLHRIAAFVEAVALLSGLEVERVAVPTWRSAIFGHQPRSADAKRISLAYVERVFGVTTSDHNLADSICIGAWGQRVGRLRELAG